MKKKKIIELWQKLVYCRRYVIFFQTKRHRRVDHETKKKKVHT
jgi:hypothetical protein